MQDLIIGSIPLFVAIIASAVFYKWLEPRWLKLFPFFLSLTFAIQLAGYFYSKFFRKSNHFIFNSLSLIEFLFYLFLFYSTPELKKYSRSIGITLLLFLLVFVYTSFISGSFFVYNTVVIIVGDLLIFGCCLLYFFRLLDSEEHRNYFVIPMFWIATAILFGNAGSFTYLSLFNFIVKNKLDPNGVIYGVIMTASSTLEYTLFTVAFSCNDVWKKAI